MTETDVGRPNRASRDRGSTAPSRTAAMGGTRVARSAGRRLASSAMSVPTRRLTTIVRVAKTRPPLGRSIPIAFISSLSPTASASPRKRPATEAISPTTTASSTTDVKTWRRDAPIVRSVASSRMRCATVIDMVLAMTKLPTKRAMPPKASRK